MSKVLCRSVIASAIAAAIGALACSDSATHREAAKPAITEPPSFTAAVVFTATLLARGNLRTFHIQSEAGDYDAELKSHDNTDIVLVRNVVGPGGHSGSH